MLARLFVLFGSLIVLALCAALVGPYFVDWSNYRADFEREASAVLGRRVEVRGDVSARLLPFPSVRFADVVVSGNRGEPALTAESFSMDAELAPFLRGEVLIFDMRLVRPKAQMTLGSDGVVDWAMSPSTPVDPGHIVIENLSVVEGQALIRDAASGREMLVNEINTDVSARSLKGPWRVQGSIRVNGRRTILTATTGMADGASMSLSLSASPEVFPVKIDSDGTVTNDAGVLRYAGKFRGAGVAPVQAELRDGDGKTARPQAQSARNRASGTFRFAGSRLDIDDFRFEAGPLADPYSAEGKAFVDLGQTPGFSIEATGQQFQVEDDSNGANGGMSLGERIAAIEDTLALVPEPTIPGAVNIRLPAVVTGQTTMRDLTLSARPEGRGWRILSASAQLPGRSTIEADGYLSGGDTPRFEGNLLLAVRQPTGFAAWLSSDIENAVRALPAAGFRSAVSIDADKQSFSGMELILGATKLSGSLERSSSGGARPVIVARLEGENIDADTGAAFAALLGEGAVREHDLDIAVKTDRLAVRDVSIGTVDAAARLTRDRLDIDRLSIGDLEGASVAATGSVRDLAGEPIGDIDLTLTGADLGPLAQRIATWMPDTLLARELARRAALNPGLLSDARVDVMGSASAPSAGVTPTQLALSFSGTVGGSRLQGSVSERAGDSNGGQVEAEVEFVNDDAVPLLALAGVPTLPISTLGPGKLSAKMHSLADGSHALTANLEGDDFKLGFEGGIALSQSFAARGKMVLKAADVEPWMLAAGAPLPGMGFGTSAELAGDGDFSKSLLVLSDLSGTLGETAISGDVNLDFGKDKPDISGALTLDDLDMEPLAIALLGAPALVSGDGLSWPAERFAARPSMPVTADIQLNVAALAVGILPPVDDATFSLKIGEAELLISELQGQSAGGRLTGFVDLTNESGNGLVSAQLQLADAAMAKLLPGIGVDAPGLEGRADVSASVTGGGQSVEAMIAGLSGSGTIGLKGLTVEGLSDAGLPSLLKQADALGQRIDEQATAGLAPQLIRQGRFEAGDASFAFNFASGVARMPATRFARENATLAAEGRIDLRGQTIEASADFKLNPGDDALVGAEPVVRFDISGPVSAPQVAFDTTGLAQFLTQRQLEIEQARVEAMQAAILERQRLRREAAHYLALNAYRAAVDATEIARRADLVRLNLRIEEQRRVEEEERRRVEEEAKAQPPALPVERPTSAPKPQSSAPSRISPPVAPAGAFPPPPGAPAGSFGDSDFDD